jgi:hypothetical protein
MAVLLQYLRGQSDVVRAKEDGSNTPCRECHRAKNKRKQYTLSRRPPREKQTEAIQHKNYDNKDQIDPPQPTIK